MIQQKRAVCFLCVLPLMLLSGCDWADRVGSHMPVMGERCEHWQCISKEGQAASERKKEAAQGQMQSAE